MAFWSRCIITKPLPGLVHWAYCSPVLPYIVMCAQRPNLKNLSRGLNFKSRLKYAWFRLKLYSMFQDLSRRSIEFGFRRI